MSTLAILAALLTLTAVMLIARPLFRADRIAAAAPREELGALRDRLLAQLHELDVQRGDQSMDPAIAAAEQKRLEFELAQVLKRLEAVSPGKVADIGAGRAKWAVAAVLLVALPLVAGGLYWLQNRHTLQMMASPEMATGEPGVPPQVLEMVARLEKRLESQPDDVRGWAQLGRSYAVLNRLQDAKAAYARAYALAPDDKDIVANYAWLLYSENPQQPSKGAVALYRKLQKQDPRNQDALWVLGLAAFHDGNYRQAVASWEKLQAGLPADSPAAKGVRAALEEARGRLQGRSSR